MFSSLDRVDIALASDADGRQQFVQTDHRSAEEIDQTAELSAIFAMVRILNPKRMAEPGAPEPLVKYFCQELPSESFRTVIASAGARLVCGFDMTNDIELPAAQPLDLILGNVMRNLAVNVATEFGVENSLEGLSRIEEQLSLSFASAEDDEIAYWLSVVKLGAFGGELIRQSNDGSWVTVDTGTLPIALSISHLGNEARVNPLGKAIKYFENGADDSLVGLVKMLCSDL